MTAGPGPRWQMRDSRSGGTPAVGDGDVPVHRHRGFDAAVGTGFVGDERRPPAPRRIVRGDGGRPRRVVCSPPVETASPSCSVGPPTPSGRRLATQQALAAEAWPVPLRVRMGIHTGEAEERGGDYFGPAVNRVARIMSEARGGQVLVSLAAAEVVRDQLGADCRSIELGERALRALKSTRARLRADADGSRAADHDRVAGARTAAADRRRHRGGRARTEAASGARPPRTGVAPNGQRGQLVRGVVAR